MTPFSRHSLWLLSSTTRAFIPLNAISPSVTTDNYNMGVLLLLSLLRRLGGRRRDCQQDYDKELRREHRRQCKRQRRWNRRHPHCPAPVPSPAVAVPVDVQPVMQQPTAIAIQQPPVLQPTCPDPTATKGISV